MKIRMRRLKTGQRNHAMFEIPEPALEWYHKLIVKGNAMGDWYDVTIALPKRTRSTGDKSQSHHFNGHCQQIAMETGNEFDAVKMWCKYKAIDMGYPFQTLATGDRFPQSESIASVGDCVLLIESAHMLAADLDIRLVENETV